MARSNTAPAWRRAFLRELARSGSVALAAQKCGIDRSSAYQVRRRNPAFAASWDQAVEAARERLASADPRVPAEARTQGGQARCSDALDPRLRGGAGKEGGARPKLRGDEIVRTSRHGRPCIMRAGPGRWSARAERAFLAELTATANVAAAARAAGVSTVAVYNRRRNSPAFAAAWAAAKAEGYERIEMLLLLAATATLDPEPAVEAREAPPMNVDQAMNLFKLHRASQLGGKPQRYGWRQQVPDIEDVRASILRKIEAIERAEARKAGPAAGAQ